MFITLLKVGPSITGSVADMGGQRIEGVVGVRPKLRPVGVLKEVLIEIVGR